MIYDPFSEEYGTLSISKMTKQSINYAFSNTYSLSLLSGMGIKINIPEDTLSSFKDKLKSSSIQEKSDFFNKITPLKAIYTKGIPVFLSNENDEGDKEISNWDESTFKKTLLPENQAFLIMNEIGLAKHLHHKGLESIDAPASDKEKYIGMLFMYLAVEQGKFCHESLRNAQGFFIAKKDKSASSVDVTLEEKKKEVSLQDQVYMMAAYANLYQVLSAENVYENYFDADLARFFQELSQQLMEYILVSKEKFYGLKTRDLVNVVPYVIDTMTIFDNTTVEHDFTATLCAEICSRELGTGKLSSERYGDKETSTSTHAKAIEALVKGYEYTQYEAFLDTARKIYRMLNHTWNHETHLFQSQKKKKIKVSTKDIGTFLNGLHALYTSENHKKNKGLLSNQICAYFDASINMSGLQIAPPYISLNLFRSEPSKLDVFDPSLMRSNENSCVLVKGFKLYPKKDKIMLDIKNYEAKYALRTSLAMLSLSNMDTIDTEQDDTNFISPFADFVFDENEDD